jgi:hypothetical protein
MRQAERWQFPLPLPPAKEIGGKLTRREVVTAPGELPVPDSQFATLECAQMICARGGIAFNALVRDTDRLETDPSLQPYFNGAGGAGLRAPFPQIHRSTDSGRLKLEWNLDYAAISLLKQLRRILMVCVMQSCDP